MPRWSSTCFSTADGGGQHRPPGAQAAAGCWEEPRGCASVPDGLVATEFYDLSATDRTELATDPLFAQLEAHLVAQGLSFDDLPEDGAGELTALLQELGFASAIERTRLKKAIKEKRAWSLGVADEPVRSGCSRLLDDVPKPIPGTSHALPSRTADAEKHLSRDAGEHCKVDGKVVAGKAVGPRTQTVGVGQDFQCQAQLEASVSAGSSAATTAEEEPLQTFEVVGATAIVRAEPHLDAKMKTKKSKGARFFCSEVTMNGWLKLHVEPGWILSDMRGIGGIDVVARPVGSDKDILKRVAVKTYQPQGLCCFVVAAANGAPVLTLPGRRGALLGLRGCGEYVFAQTQNFGGWVKLLGEEGWVCAGSSPCDDAGDDSSGLPLRRRKAGCRDLWVLSALWAAARSSRSGALGPEVLCKLLDMEQRAVDAAISLLESAAQTGGVNGLVIDGLLTEADLVKPGVWLRQRLFARVLTTMVRKDPWLRDLAPKLEPTTRPEPLPPSRFPEDEEQEEEEEE